MQNVHTQTSKKSLSFDQGRNLSGLRWREMRGLRCLALATGLSLFLLGCGGNSANLDAGGNGNAGNNGNTGGVDAGGNGNAGNTGGVDAGGNGNNGNNGGVDAGGNGNTGGSDNTNQQGLGWQGRWASAQVTPSQTAVVVPGTDKTATLWLLANDASSLSKLHVKADLTLAGKRYSLGTAAANGSELAGQYTLDQTATPHTLVLNVNDITPNPLSMTQSDVLAGQASTTDAAGRWLAKSGPLDTTWLLTAQGNSLTIEGSATTGCTWLGSATAPARVGFAPSSLRYWRSV